MLLRCDYSVNGCWNYYSNKCVTLLLFFAVVWLLPGSASAAVSTVDYYRLGEADPGAVAGQPANGFTVDSGHNAVNLAQLISSNDVVPTYSTNIGVSGSTLCVAFDGGGYTNNAAVALTNNWGIEAWVKAASTNNSLSSDGYAQIAYNGDSRYNGMGIFQKPGGQFIGLCGNVSTLTGTAIVPGTWTHLALVDNGGQTTFYVNGVATATGPAPKLPASFFGIGFNPNGAGAGEAFQGSIDEVRVFAFAPGQFSTNDLLLTSVPPPYPGAPSIVGGLVASPGTNLPAGATLTLSVDASGNPPLTYYWQQDGSPVATGTNAKIAFANVTTTSS